MRRLRCRQLGGRLARHQHRHTAEKGAGALLGDDHSVNTPIRGCEEHPRICSTILLLFCISRIQGLPSHCSPHFIPLPFPLLYLPFFSFFFPSSSHPLISHFQLYVLVPFSLLKCCLNVILLSSSSPLFLPLQTNKHCTVWTVISSPLLLCTIRVLLLRCVHSHWRSAPSPTHI